MTLRPAFAWPHWLTPLLASVVAAIVFHALGHNPFTALYGAGDGYLTGLPSKIFVAGFSSWNPWVQLGQYTYLDPQYQAFYPPGLIVMGVFPNTFGYNTFILAHYAAAGLLGYLYFRNLGLSRFAAIFGGLCFELSGFLSAHKGHTAMLSAAIWLPLMLLAVDRYFQTSQIRHLAAGALAVGLSLLGGFPQVTLYSMLLTAAYACWRAATFDAARLVDRLQRLAWTLGVVAGLGALTAAIQIVPVAASLPHLTRERLTYEMFSQDALPLYSVLCFIVPNLFGGLNDVLNYATNINLVEIYPYMGLLPVALAAGAALACAPVYRDTRFWLAAAIVALVLAFGPVTPAHRLLFEVPGYNLFRGAARHLFEVNFAICVLAAVAVDVLATPARADIRRQVMRWSATILVAAFVVAIAAAWALALAARYVETPDGAAWRQVPLNALHAVGQATSAVLQNLAVTSRTMLLPSFFLVLSLVVLAWLARRPDRRAARAALIAVVGADLYAAHSGIYKYPDTRQAFQPDTREEIAVMKAHGYDLTRDRVYPLEPGLTYTYPVLNMLSGVRVINGYSPMWGKRYRYLTNFYNSGVQMPDRVADVGLLSITSARFVLTRSPDLRGRLLARQPPIGARPIETRAPSAGEWELLHVAPIDDGLSLRSPPGAVAIARLPVTLRPNTIYIVAFEARTTGSQTSPLVVDFYGPGYDHAAQDRVLVQLAPGFEAHALEIDAGPSPPGEAMLRVFTQSTSTIDVRGVRVLTMPPGEAPFTELAVTRDGISVFENRHALPRFRFATELRPAADVADARRILESTGFDFVNAVAVEGLAAAQTVEPGAVLSHDIRDSVMRWRVRSGTRSFFVVGDTFFPGWTATVDGTPARIYAVDGILRGVFVEGAGEHDVGMVFRPERFSIGLSATVAGVLLAVGLIVGGFLRSRPPR